MMIPMRRELTFLAIGGILGAAVVLSSQKYSNAASKIAAAVPVLVSGTEIQKSGTESGIADIGSPNSLGIQLGDIEHQDDQVQQGVLVGKTAEDGDRSVNSPSAVPDPYDTMLQPRELPKTLRTPELYEQFKNDVRDNSWADAMELGISQYIAERGVDLELVFDFVECRSRYCVIAGVSYSQDRGPWNTFNSEMRSRGWWLASGGNSTVGGTYGNVTRFASVISREASDTIRPSPADGPSKQHDESTTQSAKTEMASR